MGKEELLQHYFSHLNLDVQEANYTKCPKTWREVNFVPSFNRLYLIEQGEGEIQVGGQRYSPSAHDLVIMPAQVKQSYTTISDATYLKYWVHFTAVVGERSLFQLLDTPVVLHLTPDAFIHAQHKMQELRRIHMERAWTSPLRKRAAMLQLLELYFSCLGLQQIQLRSKDADKLNVILAYMAEHIDQRITVQELARQLHLHPNYFITYFREHMGESPIQYMNKMKLEHAKQLLLTGELHIHEVAERVGMDAYYFSRQFKEFIGFSPSGYRATHRAEGK